MANWTETRYGITGEERELLTLYDTIDSLFNKNNEVWFGSLMTVLGCTEKDTDTVYCRGYVEQCVKDKTADGKLCLLLDASWAWRHSNTFHDWLKKKFPSITLNYLEIEEGDEIYCKHDPEGFYAANYLIEDGDGVYEFCNTDDDVVETFNKYYGENKKELSEVEETIEKHNEANPDARIYLYKIEEE